MEFHFFNAEYYPTSIIKSSGYETLKASGVDIINSIELRQEIIDIYEGIYQRIDEITRTSEMHSASTGWPLYAELFKSAPMELNQPFEENKETPFDYQAVLNSKKYLGYISRWRRHRLVDIEFKMQAIEEHNLVSKMIVEEIAKHND